MLFVLNQTDRPPPRVRPSCLCLFGVTSAVTLGVLREILAFVVDRFWPRRDIQSTGTGAVATIGAVVVAAMVTRTSSSSLRLGCSGLWF